MILGTAAYMSPEQARGKAVDKRADIWAFGAVLFEMLTATRAFAGDDVADVLSRVLQREPEWAPPRGKRPPVGGVLPPPTRPEESQRPPSRHRRRAKKKTRRRFAKPLAGGWAEPEEAAAGRCRGRSGSAHGRGRRGLGGVGHPAPGAASASATVCRGACGQPHCLHWGSGLTARHLTGRKRSGLRRPKFRDPSQPKTAVHPLAA